MLKYFVILVVSLFFLGSCIEEIDGVVGDYQNLLVVDGFITNESIPYRVKLSRTVPNIDEPYEAVSNAKVYIEDDKGGELKFTETGRGVYVSNDSSYVGEVGTKYRLTIIAREGGTYQSEWCLLNEPTPIDSVYFEAEKYFDQAKYSYSTGMSIFVDGLGDQENDSYLRWSYQEDWKFKVPYPDVMHYDLDSNVVFHPAINEECWKSSASSSVVLHSFENQTNNSVLGKKLKFIRPMEDDRVSLRYRIKVKQHSISKQEFDFWNNLKLSTQDVGDIFGKQPFSVYSNLHRVDDPKEPVLGYFQVSGVSTEHLYVDFFDLSSKRIPVRTNHYSCDLDTVLIDNVNYFDDYSIYKIEVLVKGRGFVNPLWDELTAMEIVGLVLVHKSCQDCSYAGSKFPPVDWIDKDEEDLLN